MMKYALIDKRKLSTAEKHELKLFHTAVFLFHYEQGRREVKLPCALLHYVIDASCCTTSIEISCRVRLTARRNLCRPC
ncbi:hypothetical protein T4A_5271 [Trichinella pseudospiralis]|uniref:Uncharacterized protein n=1 Tax=Trichinella pseudospiralis TaxID=6337 RepID=A0A0V1E5H5_TRIPS|nr:hypothetical protein T4A_5271 [Trichinella pseudospiralis]